MEKKRARRLCPICDELMTVGVVDRKLVAVCHNKDCQSVLVFGKPIQEAFKKVEEVQL